jgi:hypothetical protein
MLGVVKGTVPLTTPKVVNLAYKASLNYDRPLWGGFTEWFAELFCIFGIKNLKNALLFGFLCNFMAEKFTSFVAMAPAGLFMAS